MNACFSLHSDVMRLRRAILNGRKGGAISSIVPARELTPVSPQTTSFGGSRSRKKFGTVRFYWDGKLSDQAEINVEEAIARPLPAPAKSAAPKAGLQPAGWPSAAPNTRKVSGCWLNATWKTFWIVQQALMTEQTTNPVTIVHSAGRTVVAARLAAGRTMRRRVCTESPPPRLECDTWAKPQASDRGQGNSPSR